MSKEVELMLHESLLLEEGNLKGNFKHILR